MMDVDLGVGHGFPVGIEHAAVDREHTDRIERVGFGAVAAQPVALLLGRREPVLASGLIAPRNQAAEAAQAISPAPSRAAEASFSF